MLPRLDMIKSRIHKRMWTTMVKRFPNDKAIETRRKDACWWNYYGGTNSKITIIEEKFHFFADLNYRIRPINTWKWFFNVKFEPHLIINHIIKCYWTERWMLSQGSTEEPIVGNNVSRHALKSSGRKSTLYVHSRIVSLHLIKNLSVT